jgi:hypothetical protein
MIRRIPRAVVLLWSSVLIGCSLAYAHLRYGDELEIEIDTGGK